MAPSKDEIVEEYRIRSIREAAVRVISARGVTGATMQEIAEEAGVAKGTIYLYFESREELCQAAAAAAFAEIAGRLEATLLEPRPFPETLRALVRTKIESVHAHRELFRVYLATRYPEGEVPHGSPRPRHEHALYDRYLERFAGFLSAAMERGEVRRGDPARFALFLAEAVNGILLRRLSEGAPPPPEEDVEWIVTVLLRGLTPERRKA